MHEVKDSRQFFGASAVLFVITEEELNKKVNKLLLLMLFCDNIKELFAGVFQWRDLILRKNNQKNKEVEGDVD